MQEPISTRFFLGANSSQGFVSFFDNAVHDPAIRQNYIFKGGPGCGKSTAMKRVVAAALNQGQPCEIIHCSSDPDSLDGALFPQAAAAVYDGTAPHTIELAFPGAEGSYITPPPFLNQAELAEKTEQLRQTNQQLAGHYRQAFRLIAAAGKVHDSVAAKLAPLCDLPRLEKRAAGIISREIPRGEKGQQPGLEKKRFLSGITPQGLLCFYETAQGLAQNIYDLRDPYGFGHVLLSPILSAALAAGQQVYACYSPLFPDRLEHLILPDLSLAFLTSNSYHAYASQPYRRINLDVADREGLRLLRGEIRLLRKIEQSLLEDAVEQLRGTKGLHDRLEALYRPHLDFTALDHMGEQVISAVSGK